MPITQEQHLKFVSAASNIVTVLDRLKEFAKTALRAANQDLERLKPQEGREEEIARTILEHVTALTSAISEAGLPRQIDVDLRAELKYYAKHYKHNVANAKRLRAIRAYEQDEATKARIIPQRGFIGGGDPTVGKDDWLKDYMSYAGEGAAVPAPTGASPNITIDPQTGRKVLHQSTPAVSLPPGVKMDDEDGTASMKDIKPGEDVI